MNEWTSVGWFGGIVIKRKQSEEREVQGIFWALKWAAFWSHSQQSNIRIWCVRGGRLGKTLEGTTDAVVRDRCVDRECGELLNFGVTICFGTRKTEQKYSVFHANCKEANQFALYFRSMISLSIKVIIWFLINLHHTFSSISNNFIF